MKIARLLITAALALLMAGCGQRAEMDPCFYHPKEQAAECKV